MKPDISIVIPVMNEAESVGKLAEEISEVMRGQTFEWECLWVDDGSTDNTLSILIDIHKRLPNHKCLQMERNSGQSAALAAGFRASTGTFIATLDGDGQNDPLDLPVLLQYLQQEGVDMVNGIRAKRRDTIVRKISSKLANGFRNWLTNEQVSDVGCAIRIFRRECVSQIPIFKGMHRFLPTLVRMRGYTISEHAVRHRSRETGVTKYGINNRLWVGIGDTLAVFWMLRRLTWAQAHFVTETEDASQKSGARSQ